MKTRFMDEQIIAMIKKQVAGEKTADGKMVAISISFLPVIEMTN